MAAVHYTTVQYTVLDCTVLCCTVLYCAVQYCAVLYCAVLLPGVSGNARVPVYYSVVQVPRRCAFYRRGTCAVGTDAGTRGVIALHVGECSAGMHYKAHNLMNVGNHLTNRDV